MEPIVSNVSNTPLFNRIKLSESVCVSVRSWAEVEQFQNVISSRMVCDKQYFKNAIAKMKELHPNCTLIIFSDNAEFAKNNIDADENTIFENEGNTIEDKILLMSSCKHFILSNSSFSWWVQYLSNDNEKTVISPNRWYNDKIDNRLINDNWIICF